MARLRGDHTDSMRGALRAGPHGWDAVYTLNGELYQSQWFPAEALARRPGDASGRARVRRLDAGAVSAMSTDGGRRLVDGMTIPEAMETAAHGLDAVIEEELGELAARGTAEDVLVQERARLEARRTAILAELWTKLEGDPPR